MCYAVIALLNVATAIISIRDHYKDKPMNIQTVTSCIGQLVALPIDNVNVRLLFRIRKLDEEV